MIRGILLLALVVGIALAVLEDRIQKRIPERLRPRKRVVRRVAIWLMAAGGLGLVMLGGC